jgi:fatty-acid desaturase
MMLHHMHHYEIDIEEDSMQDRSWYMLVHQFWMMLSSLPSKVSDCCCDMDRDLAGNKDEMKATLCQNSISEQSRKY